MIEQTAEQVLRNTRNMMLVNSDWQMMKANETNTNVNEWLNYRQALRDLPSNSLNAALDEQGNLINVTWPEMPQ